MKGTRYMLVNRTVLPESFFWAGLECVLRWTQEAGVSPTTDRPRPKDMDICVVCLGDVTNNELKHFTEVEERRFFVCNYCYTHFVVNGEVPPETPEPKITPPSRPGPKQPEE